MEVKLTDNSKLSLTRLADDRLRLALYQPKTLRDGHGCTLVGHVVLESKTLEALLSEMHSATVEETPDIIRTVTRRAAAVRSEHAKP